MNSLKKISLLTALCLLLGTTVSAQYKYKSILKKADKQYELHAYNLAKENYLSVLERRQDDSAEPLARLADCFRHLNQMDAAAEWYAKAMRFENVKPIHILHYGKVMKALGRYDVARAQFLRYSQSNPIEGRHYAQSCDFARSQIDASSSYKVSAEYVNTSASEFGPSFIGEQVIFSSARTDILRSSSDWTGMANNQLFISEEGDGGYLKSPMFLKNTYKESFNEGPVAYSPDRRIVVFTKNNFVDGTRQISSSGMSMNLYIADVGRNGEWTRERPFPYNGTSFSTGFPSFSPQGDALYFASNRPDGFGGYDIFVSYFRDGNWYTPENLGPVVNSPGDEVTPYFDGNFLFFSSDWHYGFGGYDVFRAEQNDGRWSRIFHLGNTVNSTYDDYGFIYDSFRNIGYFSSNRKDGKGLEDIYRVTKSADNVVIQVKSASDGMPVPNAIVDFNLCGEGTFFTDGRGRYSFQAVQGLSCNVIVRKEGYINNNIVINTAGLTQSRQLEVFLSKPGEEYPGRIINYNTQTPIANVNVVATNLSTGSVMETRTDENGEYSLALSANSVYKIRYSRPGYREINRTVQTEDGKDRSLLRIISLLTTSQEDFGEDEELFPRVPGEIFDDPVIDDGFDEDIVFDDTPTEGFSIQLAALKSANTKAFANVEDFGRVYAKEENKRFKIRLGIFSSRTEAGNVLSSVKKRGYKGAFIVKEDGKGVDFPSQEFPRGPAVDNFGLDEEIPVESSYKIQLAAYRDASWFDDNLVNHLGPVSEEARGEWTVMFINGFQTLSEARQALREVVMAGFDTAFVLTRQGDGWKKVK